MTLKLLSVSNPKLLSGEGRGYRTFGLSLAPSDMSGYQVCPGASPACRLACLGKESGRAHCSNVKAARIRKTKWYFEDRPAFLLQLIKDIKFAIRNAERAGLIPAFRLNVFSDIRWENHGIPQNFPNVQFYDYTKLANRKVPANYDLTFSRSEDNGHLCNLVPYNVAVVFRHTLPDEYMGYRVIDGTVTDLRFTDPKGVVVGLLAKGKKARNDLSGFVEDYVVETEAA